MRRWRSGAAGAVRGFKRLTYALHEQQNRAGVAKVVETPLLGYAGRLAYSNAGGKR